MKQSYIAYFVNIQQLIQKYWKCLYIVYCDKCPIVTLAITQKMSQMSYCDSCHYQIDVTKSDYHSYIL